MSQADPLRSRLVSWLEVVVLGIVQGLTEFLPISSSAHLRIVSGVFFGNDPGAAFTAVSQLGTEAAVLVYFARDIAHLVAVWFRGLRSPEARADPDYRLAWLVIIGTIPIAVLGVLFKHQIETVARNLWLIATTMVVFGVLLGLAEYYGQPEATARSMRDGYFSVGDVAGEVDEHRRLGAELAHRREGGARVVAEEHPRHDAEVGGGGDGQELGEPLHDPQHDDFEPRHEARP